MMRSIIDEETLWNMMKFLYPKMTLDDFNETLETDGWYDTVTRIKINFKDRHELIKKYGGDGLSRYRELYEDLKSGELDKRIQDHRNKLIRMKQLVNKK